MKLNIIDEYFKGLNVQVRFQIFSDDVLVIQNKDCVINLNFCQAVKVKQLSNKNFFIYNKVYYTAISLHKIKTYFFSFFNYSIKTVLL